MIAHFGTFVICKIDPTFLQTSIRLKNRKHKSNYLKIIVSEEGTYNFSVYQQSKRKIADKKYEYSSTRLILVK
jgi:hypothetical protein